MNTEPMSIDDVKALLEGIFKGCKVKTPGALMGSFHAEVAFDDYEVRVILTGRRLGPNREMHFRFLQKIRSSMGKAQKLVINELSTQDEAELVAAIKGVKEYLLGVVQSINRALQPPYKPKMSGPADLFRDDIRDEED